MNERLVEVRRNTVLLVSPAIAHLHESTTSFEEKAVARARAKLIWALPLPKIKLRPLPNNVGGRVRVRVNLL